jgi:hypothetical protein
MRIKRLARKAVFITATVMVLAGFSTGIAGTASAAPTSAVSVSAVASGGTPAVPHMPASCGTHFCTIGLVPHAGEYIIQVFNCSPPKQYKSITNPIYAMQNNCSNRVYWFDRGVIGGCLNPHSSKSGVGRFGTVTIIETSSSRSPTGC